MKTTTITTFCVSIIAGFAVGIGLAGGVGAAARSNEQAAAAAPPAKQPAPPPAPAGQNFPKDKQPAVSQSAPAAFQLGNFSVSLTVKDLAASRAFYENLGFHVFGGDAAQHWLIMQNDTATIGIFQGMFEKNMLTFNPGWDRNGKKALPKFDDIRDIQKSLKAKGVKFSVEADENSTGPASFITADPDGNVILVDQFVDRPAPPTP